MMDAGKGDRLEIMNCLPGSIRVKCLLGGAKRSERDCGKVAGSPRKMGVLSCRSVDPKIFFDLSKN